MWGSPGFPRSDDEVRAMAGRAWDRDHDASGINRHVLATAMSGDRREMLRGVRVPSLVIHGADDTLVLPENGREIASLIPGARLEIVDGMGHVITPALAPLLVDMVDGFIRSL